MNLTSALTSTYEHKPPLEPPKNKANPRKRQNQRKPSLHKGLRKKPPLEPKKTKSNLKPSDSPPRACSAAKIRQRRTRAPQISPADLAFLIGFSLTNRLMFRMACRSRCSFSTRAIRIYPSPFSPNARPGAIATSAWSISSIA